MAYLLPSRPSSHRPGCFPCLSHHRLDHLCRLIAHLVLIAKTVIAHHGMSLSVQVRATDPDSTLELCLQSAA